MKSIWKGSIAFGLVNIPIKIYSATSSSALDLDMLDRKDHSRIRYKKVNENTNREVDIENIVKGYFYKDDFVILEAEDFLEAAPEKTKLIEIEQFILEKEIDTIYYETPYYLEPEKSGFKAYGLLREALKKSGKIAVATFVLRNTETLCVIKPLNKILILNKIRFQEEVRASSDIKVPASTEVKPAELKMALALIKQFSGKFNLSAFKDDYSAELLKIIKAKAAGKKTKIRKLTPTTVKSKDLMDQLKASLTVKRKKAS
ncbi:MAG: Ku protein [Chitinophagales bacterium]|jgi:DNA end-binding protein Ku|nr:Ku protein [Bacteroidota bacterium]MBP9221856.1 Ku protein [Chitinophagales bacterium]